MKKTTRKAALILGLCLLLTTSSFAMVDELVKNTCKLSFNFFGIVRVWSGEKTYTAEDMYGNTYTYTTGCGEDGGTWDWFWE